MDDEFFLKNITELNTLLKNNEIAIAEINTKINIVSKAIIIIPTIISLITFIGNYLDVLMHFGG